MAFVTGMLFIDAPAAALNNLGSIPGAREDNSVGVKVIKTREGSYPYVSAQAFRYWLRTTLEQYGSGWVSAPVFREEKIAYTDANPLIFWDDDIFGYMRASSQKESAKAKREADASQANATETTTTITRLSPFRMSTLVSIAPVSLTDDFGVMARQEGNPVPHEHQFYHTTLKGLFSLNLNACGTFSYRKKTGFQNLDDVRIKLAQGIAGIEHLPDVKSYRLPAAQRMQRIKALFEGLAHLEGGAKQALHYTDITPGLTFAAITKGGNHIFNHIAGADPKGLPTIKIDALKETLAVYAQDVLSPIYVGWARGYMDSGRAAFEQFAQEYNADHTPVISMQHPREAFLALAQDLEKHPEWLA